MFMNAGIHIVILLNMYARQVLQLLLFIYEHRNKSKTVHGAWGYYAPFRERVAASRDVGVKITEWVTAFKQLEGIQMPQLVLEKAKSLKMCLLWNVFK